MRDKWYGDNRDLIKWGILLELSKRCEYLHVLQVLFYRSNTWASIQIEGEEIDLCSDVIRHFRDVSAIAQIRAGLTIEVIADEFHDRSSYLRTVFNKIDSRMLRPSIVFLDPDTGLEPKGKAGPEHVLVADLMQIWEHLRRDDLLVFYQHKTNRSGAEWVIPKKEQFERALGVQPGSAKIARAPKIANDVAFFYAKKG